MTTWTDESKAKAVQSYKDAGPTAANSTEIVKQIAEDMELSPNAVRMVLIQAGVYIKKDEAASSTTSSGTKKATGTGTKKASKEELHAALVQAIEAKGAAADMDIIGKLTGKAAEYFTGVLSA